MTSSETAARTFASETRIVGRLPLDPDGFEDELEIARRLPSEGDYSEYVFGHWRSVPLANPSGAMDDTTFRLDAETLHWTELGRRLGRIRSWIEGHMHLDRLRWVRLFVHEDGLLATHRDFLEFDEPTLRLGIPLSTTEDCLHSSGWDVFHMRPGEIWSLDPAVPHSAYTPEGRCRISVVLDFALGSADPSAPFPGLGVVAAPAIRRIERPPLTDEERSKLIGLGSALDWGNLRDVVRVLASVHFFRHCHVTEWFDWLIEAAMRARDPRIAEVARAYRRFTIEHRAIGERFSFDRPRST